jgi:hypothetical protein
MIRYGDPNREGACPCCGSTLGYMPADGETAGRCTECDDADEENQEAWTLVRAGTHEWVTNSPDGVFLKPKEPEPPATPSLTEGRNVGWVYVVSNPAMSGMVKVGFSLKDGKEERPEKRPNGLDNTSVPLPFIVEYAAIVENADTREDCAHARLEHCRVRRLREFFYCTVAEAIAAIRDDGEPLNEYIRDIALEEEAKRVIAAREAEAKRIIAAREAEAAAAATRAEKIRHEAEAQRAAKDAAWAAALDATRAARSRRHRIRVLAVLLISLVWLLRWATW